MRILLLSPLPPPNGGIATWTVFYLESEKAKSNHVDIVNTAVCGMRIGNYTRRNYWDELKRAIKILNQTEEHLKAESYDVFHINTSCSLAGMVRDYLCIKKLRNKTATIVIQFHCDTSYMIKDAFSRYIFRKLCKKGDKLFCLNTASQKHIKKLSNRKSILVPNFIDDRLVEKLGEKKIAEKIQNILYVGHITKAKGCEDIITVAKSFPHIDFKLIGYLSAEIKNIKTPDNIEFVGELPRDQVLNAMMNADLLLFPSLSEGFPNAVLEAMACGLPIIGTKVGAIPDMIENKGGVLVNPGCIDEIIRAIKILEDPKARKSIRDWNKNKVEQNYIFNNVINQIFKEYSTD